MNKRIKLLLVSISILFLSACHQYRVIEPDYDRSFDETLIESSNKNEYSIIVGKPYKIKDSPNELVTNSVQISSLYIVYFKDYRVVAGNLKKKRVLKVEIQASSGGVIFAHPEIYVVIKNSDKKILDGGDRWGKPFYAVCLPVDDIKDYGLGDEFGQFVFNTGRRCKGLYEQEN